MVSVRRLRASHVRGHPQTSRDDRHARSVSPEGAFCRVCACLRSHETQLRTSQTCEPAHSGEPEWALALLGTATFAQWGKPLGCRPREAGHASFDKPEACSDSPSRRLTLLPGGSDENAFGLIFVLSLCLRLTSQQHKLNLLFGDGTTAGAVGPNDLMRFETTLNCSGPFRTRQIRRGSEGASAPGFTPGRPG